jgi:import inner membrane translocase subunit TIM50
MGLEDVRVALKSYEGKDIAKEFARREAAMRAELARRRALESGASGGAKRSGFAALIGGGGAQQQPGQTPLPGDKMVFDLIREEGMRGYKRMEEQIKAHGAQWLREEAEAMKMMEESSVKDMKKSFVGGVARLLPFVGDGDEAEQAEQAKPAAEAAAPAVAEETK